MWERLIPRKHIRMLRKENLVEVIPRSHTLGRFILKRYPTTTLNILSRGKGRDTQIVL